MDGTESLEATVVDHQVPGAPDALHRLDERCAAAVVWDDDGQGGDLEHGAIQGAVASRGDVRSEVDECSCEARLRVCSYEPRIQIVVTTAQHLDALDAARQLIDDNMHWVKLGRQLLDSAPD